MRFFYSFVLAGLGCLAFAQRSTPVEIPDAKIDAFVEALRKTSWPLDARLTFGRWARFNWPRVMWHYRHADPELRIRLVFVTARPYNPVWYAAHADPLAHIRWDAMDLDLMSEKKFPAMWVEKWLRDPWPPNRVLAILHAHRIGRMDLVRPLMRDPSPVVQVEAALGFAHSGDKQAIAVLVKNLGLKLPEYATYNNPSDMGGGDRDVYVHLARIGTPALPVVRPLLKSKDKKRRWLATDVVGWIKGKGFFEDMSKMVHDPDPDVRYAAYYRLAESRRKDAIPILVRALDDRAWPEQNGESGMVRNVRYLLSGYMVDRPWPEGIAALRAYDHVHKDKDARS